MSIRLLTIALLATALASPAFAHVTRIEVQSRTTVTADNGAACELITGRVHGEADPKDKHNSIITDLQLAPRNAKGMVEYTTTFALARPVDGSRVTNVLFYDTPNRGNGRATCDPEGHMHVISGWQGDIPAGNLQRADFPIARHADGSPVTGPVLVRFINQSAASVAITGGLNAGVPRPEPLSMASSKAKLVRKKSDTDTAKPIASTDWAFADCRSKSFPGTPDPHMLCLKAGFDPAYAYELTYTAKDPVVLGLGFAAVRDLVAFLRYSGDAAANPVANQVKWTIGTGNSQSGNFLRSFIQLGFNEGEDARPVFDGLHPNIAARQVPLNLRFGVPGGAANLYEPGSEGVLWWGKYSDKSRGNGTTSLLDRCSASKTCPKIVDTFGSAEFWGLRASQDLVGIDAKADIPLPDNVRRYYFPSVTHGGGSGGFSLKTANPPASCSLPANPNPSSDSMRAITRALVDWVTTDKTPPDSRYPRLANNDLVAPNSKAMGFPKIPKAPSPDGKLNEFVVQSFGKGFAANDVSGVMTLAPPKVLKATTSYVPRVNADGNETSGVPSVQARVPLGTYLGWNTFAAGYYKGAGCGFQGGYIPFATTKAERLASGDPRLSLEERYGTHAAFVDKVKTAALDLINEGFLLTEDAQRIIKQAQDSDVLAGR